MDLIVAVDQNWGIGKNNDLLFHIPEDMKFFREKTAGKALICGRKTLESFPGGNPLPNRRHFVLTRTGTIEKDVCTCHDLESLFRAIADIPTDEVMVIGGESIYRQLLAYCNRAFVTKVAKKDGEATVFFPNLDEDPSFEIEEEGELQISKNGLPFRFVTYRNVK